MIIIRIKTINDPLEPKNNGKYILYWMQQSQRIEHNYGLEHAIKIANNNNLPLTVFFGLSPSYPEANRRHYFFMLEGLKELEPGLKKLNINFIIKIISPDEGIISLLKDCNELILDHPYNKTQKKWKEKVMEQVRVYSIKTYSAESDLVVPIESTSDKLEYSARTIRPKLMSKYMSYLDSFKLDKVNTDYNNYPSDPGVKLFDLNKIIEKLEVDASVKEVEFFTGGEKNAKKILETFLSNKFDNYLESGDPTNDFSSKLSPYLHFGQISSIYIIKKVLSHYRRYESNFNPENYNKFIEQLLVRRELAFNYIYYNEGYDDFYKMTDEWAYKTMRNHDYDERVYLYELVELEGAKTHDVYWNASMMEMKITGYMHNYMRMYWAKKIIEWTANYKQAYEIILYLNNRYFLDGRDANSYASIAWVFGKHDRAWTERNIFGKLRYMNQNGLKRKFQIERYVKKINSYKK